MGWSCDKTMKGLLHDYTTEKWKRHERKEDSDGKMLWSQLTPAWVFRADK